MKICDSAIPLSNDIPVCEGDPASETFGAVDFHADLMELGKEIVIREGLDLRELPAGQYEIICLPLKIGGNGYRVSARTILRRHFAP